MKVGLGLILSMSVAVGLNASERWDVEVASVPKKPGYVGPGVDFAVDAAGTFHMCYASTEPTQDTVTYLRWSPGGLQERVKLSTKPRRTYVPKIALAPSGEPVVLFVDADGVKLAKRTAGTWSTEVLSTFGHYEFTDLSLAIGSTGHAHVLFNGTNYIDKVFLRYMHESESGWVTHDFLPLNSFLGNHGAFHDLVLSDGDSPHIVYQESSAENPYYPVKYIHRDSNGDYLVEHVSNYNNLGDMEMVRSADGVIHVVHPYANSMLAYCNRALDGVWREEKVMDPRTGREIQFAYADIALEEGIPIISYKSNGSALSTASRKAGAWECADLRPIDIFGPRLGLDHRGGLCFIFGLRSGIGLIFPASSHLPKVGIAVSEEGGMSISMEGLTPGARYDLMQSPDLMQWSRIRELPGLSSFHTAEIPMVGDRAFYRVELQRPSTNE